MFENLGKEICIAYSKHERENIQRKIIREASCGSSGVVITLYYDLTDEEISELNNQGIRVTKLSENHKYNLDWHEVIEGKVRLGKFDY
ncbi:MAG: hypothetical protein J6573_04705 [Lactobacillus sp.]|nr:hypothetical protein [Lactobacillus sp.]